MTLLIIIQFLECDSFSQKACENAAKTLGLQLGGDEEKFAGDYSVKGCHAYKSGHRAGLAFYGTSGVIVWGVADRAAGSVGCKHLAKPS